MTPNTGIAGVGHGPAARRPHAFGKRHEPTTITITRGGRARQFTVSPLLFSIAFSVAAMFMAGYLVATAYLVFRDDLIGAAKAHNARLLYEYEDRIAALRTNLDRVVSRQLLDQQAIEARIAELMQRQEMLGGRGGRFGGLVDEARRRGLDPAANGDKRHSRLPQAVDGATRTAGIAPGTRPRPAAADGFSLRGTHAAVLSPQGVVSVTAERPAPDITDRAATAAMFSTVAERIEMIDSRQRAMLDRYREAANERAARIAGVMKSLKVPVSEPVHDQIGGPFIPLGSDAPFETHAEALDMALKTLDRMTARLESVPLANPAPGKHVSSAFGSRIDPFLGRAAMHSGIDFRAAAGETVRAPASGTVIDAGRNGGYGNMVEIDHGGGLTTRFAHLSRILVSAGDEVKRGTAIGKVGSTGRSTGPHLHYEIRRNGTALDPARYLKAGRQLAGLL